MDGHRHHLVLIATARLAGLALQCAHHAFNDGIHHLEVRRIGHEAQLHLTTFHHSRTVVAHVVLHVAGRVLVGGVMMALELGKQRLVRLAHHIREHVETAAVCHADHHLGRAFAAQRVDHRIEHGDERVGAFHGETLVALIRAPEEALEAVDFIEAREHLLLLVGRERAREDAIAEGPPEPVALLVHLEMPHLVANAPRVHAALARDEILGGGVAIITQGGAGDRFEIGLREAVEFGAQFVGAGRRRAEGIELYGIVAEHANGLLQRRGGGDLGKQRGVHRTGGGCRRGGGPEQRLGNTEILTPRLVDAGRIATVSLELLGENAVVEGARNG